MEKKNYMLFSERKKLADEYEEWINKPLEDGSKIKDCALSVITFMSIKGYLKPNEDAVVLTGTATAEYLEYLLVDFDEMSFFPATLTPNPEEYAREWKRKLIYAIGQLRKETAKEIYELLEKWVWKLKNEKGSLGNFRFAIETVMQEIKEKYSLEVSNFKLVGLKMGNGGVKN